jgi:hypothetical protein
LNSLQEKITTHYGRLYLFPFTYPIKGEDPLGTTAPLPAFFEGNITAELSTIPLIIEVGISLPVELIEFKGTCINNQIQLSWSTLSETNHSHFEIYKKNATSSWKLLGEVKGNDYNGINNYTFLDSSLDDVNLYRLKQIDLDGRYEYSDMISISNCSLDKVEIYPNPAHDLLFIQYKSDENKKVSFNIFDTRGSVMLHLEKELRQGTQIIELDVSILSKGVYFIEIRSNGKSKKEKIVIF